MIARTGTAALFLAVASAGLARAAPQALQRLSSPSGLQVSVPATWRGMARQDGALEATSPGRGAEGVVIDRGQAYVVVTPVDIPADGGVADAIAADIRDDRVVSRTTLAPTSPSPDRCGPITMVETLDEVGPRTDQRLMLLYCQAGGRSWRVLLTCWQDDPASLRRRWRETVVAVAHSLRAPGA